VILKQILVSPLTKQVKIFLFALIIVITGCSLQKKTGFNRTMQNLTAHYNILFNANELLQQKQDSYALAFIDSYNNPLNVYPDTTFQNKAIDKDLEAVIIKANTIINEKEQSHYIGDAYLVLGKANYLLENYFNSVEYFSYVVRSFPKQTTLVQEALIWKARSLLYLNQLPQAKLVLDTALKNTDTIKRHIADVYATKLQYDINTQQYADAEEMAKKAIFYCKENSQKLRWIFILGQLQELNQQNKEAFISYTRIVNSNVSFEMAFNANLNRIRIEDEQNGIKTNRITRLLSLLKNQNNKEFTDQIYYQIAEIYLLNKDIDNAIKNYKLSVRNSKTNQNQKGLSYLRMADIDFRYKADYVNAKKYYDSTLTNLSLNYPGYQAIQKKSSNLQLLIDRLLIIAREDTLQALAKMDEKTRKAHIDALVSREILQQKIIAANNSAAASAMNNTSAAQTNRYNSSNFYFYNAKAVSQGYSDFKRKWGDRKLEDNWRRSNRPASDIANNNPTILNGDPDELPANLRKSKTDVTASAYRQQLLQDIPVTPQLLAQSNTRIYNAYLDIANFYRDILDDKKEAIANYLFILTNFPDSPDKAALYYNLYRLYSEIDTDKSAQYKNKLLKDYPETVFAKIILDPDYSKKLNDNDALFNTAYSQVYDLYRQKKYAKVVADIDILLKQYPLNKYNAQLYYLRAIAAGHQEKLAPFQSDLQQIAGTYPNDRLITPLIEQHLAYIGANKADLSAQPFALMDNDTTEVVFTPPIVYQQQTAYRRIIKQEAEVKSTETKLPAKTEPAKTIAAPVKSMPAQVAQLQNIPKAAPVIFSLRDSTNYYFVVNVSTGTTDLSSSRFGIGQFNRTNFPPNKFRHQLKAIGPDNQLIYVGSFNSLSAVKDYARAIIPLMPEIMQVPKDKYSFFIITQENLDKLADGKTLNSYIDYYQKTY
jgi:tetratricopeptide (TPR) repeat protein